MGQFFLWIGVFVAALIIEGVTMQLVSIWFAVGALGALLTAFFGGSLLLQTGVFVILSLLLFLVTRPLVQKMGRGPTVRTNADSVIGMEGIVKEKIDTLSGTGRVYVNGLSWAAKADSVIDKDQKIIVLSMEGVTLTVRLADSDGDGHVS